MVTWRDHQPQPPKQRPPQQHERLQGAKAAGDGSAAPSEHAARTVSFEPAAASCRFSHMIQDMERKYATLRPMHQLAKRGDGTGGGLKRKRKEVRAEEEERPRRRTDGGEAAGVGGADAGAPGAHKFQPAAAATAVAAPTKAAMAGTDASAAAGGGAAGGAPSRVPWSHELWSGGTLPRRSRTVLHDRGFTAELLPHADSANATNGSGSEEAHAGLQGDRCTWRVRVNNSGRERTQIDIAVGGNAWAVTAPERTPVLRSSASWTFEVVEELPTARRLTVDAFTVRLCARLDGVTCAALRLVCRCERLPTRVVIDEHGWTA